VSKRLYSHAHTFQVYATISTVCLFLAVLSGAFIGLSVRMRLLPSYIFFFSFAAFSVMLFQTILTHPPQQLQQLDLREQRGVLAVALAVSALCVFSELTLIPWPKILAGLMLGAAVIVHGWRVWRGHRPREIWKDISYRFFITDMFFLLVAAVGLFALGWKETWPDFHLIPAFLRPATVFLGASFPLTLTFTGYLYRFAQVNGGLSAREERIVDWWYYVLVGGVVSFLAVILLDLRAVMQTMAVTLAVGVFVVNALFAGRLARNPRSVSTLYAYLGLAGLLAASTAGNCLIASNTPTIPAGQNPLLLSHVHMAQLLWVCISFWGIQYTLWPTMLQLDRSAQAETPTRTVVWLPANSRYPAAARALIVLQLVLAIGSVGFKVASHMRDDYPMMLASGLAYAAATLLPLPILGSLKRSGQDG
jgi:hypothetical protein